MRSMSFIRIKHLAYVYYQITPQKANLFGYSEIDSN